MSLERAGLGPQGLPGQDPGEGDASPLQPPALSSLSQDPTLAFHGSMPPPEGCMVSAGAQVSCSLGASFTQQGKLNCTVLYPSAKSWHVKDRKTTDL